MRCPSCATDNDPTSVYCAVCGVALPSHAGGPAQPPAGFETPAQYGPGWPPDASHPSGEDPYAAYRPPPYADNAGPGYPTWLAAPPPTSGPGAPGAPVSPGYPAAPYDPNAYPAYPAYLPPPPQASVISNSAPPYPRPRSRSMVGLVVVVAVVVVIAVASFAAVTLTGHKKTPVANPTRTSETSSQPQPQPTTTTTAEHNITATTAAPDPAVAHHQAAAIDSLLTASVASRRKLNNAIDKVNRCTDLEGAEADMNAVGEERQQEIASVQNTDLSAIPTGGQVRDLLVQALQYSKQADVSYTAWAQGALDNGCSGSDQRNRDYAEGQRLSGLAKQAKSDFLAAWNPVASANGVSARSPDDI